MPWPCRLIDPDALQSVAPTQAENVDLWECPDCGRFSVSWHPHPEARDS